VIARVSLVDDRDGQAGRTRLDEVPSEGEAGDASADDHHVEVDMVGWGDHVLSMITALGDSPVRSLTCRHRGIKGRSGGARRSKAWSAPTAVQERCGRSSLKPYRPYGM
jgi:hypothetical protein